MMIDTKSAGSVRLPWQVVTNYLMLLGDEKPFPLELRVMSARGVQNASMVSYRVDSWWPNRYR